MLSDIHFALARSPRFFEEIVALKMGRKKQMVHQSMQHF
jgi:hypothetical protein